MGAKKRLLSRTGGYEFFVLENAEKLSLESLERFISPVKQYEEEEVKSGVLDDYSEEAHLRKWLGRISGNEKDQLTVFSMEKSGKVFGVVFFLGGSGNFAKFLQEQKLETVSINDSMQLSGFHIVKSVRGRGEKWLTEIVFPYLCKKGVVNIFLHTSHQKAFSLYEKLGEEISSRQIKNDKGLFTRLEKIYKLTLRSM